jgi:DNA-binding transcriptional MerR regulator
MIETQVEFVTFGEAAKMLDVNANTLRGWCDKFEEMNTHFLDRNHRKERIFYENDLEIFRYVKEQKDLHGMKITTQDIVHTVAQRSKEDDMFELRTKGELPSPPTFAPAISEPDIKKLIDDERFQGVLKVIVKQVSEEASNKVEQQVSEKVAAKLEEIEKRRAESLNEVLSELREIKKYQALPWYKKIGKSNPGRD